MQTKNPILDDLAKVASGALSVATGVKEEVEARLRQQFERIIEGMDLVTREEFEVVRAMAAEARAQNERLEKRLAKLEAALAEAKTPRPARKAAPRKRPARPRAAPPGGEEGQG